MSCHSCDDCKAPCDDKPPSPERIAQLVTQFAKFMDDATQHIPEEHRPEWDDLKSSIEFAAPEMTVGLWAFEVAVWLGDIEDDIGKTAWLDEVHKLWEEWQK